MLVCSPMQTLGILGGTGPESTIDYYRLILEEHARQRPGMGNPPLLINCVNFEEIMPFANAQDWRGLAEWIAPEFEKLRRAGADFGLIAANTPHLAMPFLRPICPLPLLSIVEATASFTLDSGFRRVGLLGTRSTMEARMYPDELERARVEVRIPSEPDREYVNRKYFDELFVGTFLDETRQGLIEVIRRMVEREGIDAVILGGTELPLMLRDNDEAGIPLLDTARIHCKAAVLKILA